MSQLFNRNAVVTIGTSSSGGGKRIAGLRISFSVEKSLESAPNTAKISVYNLSEDTRALFEQSDSVITLSVGYGTERDVELIFAGNVARFAHKKQGPDWVTEVEAGDGEADYQTAKVDESFPPGTPILQVLKTVSGGFKDIKNTAVQLIASAKQYVNGYVASGGVRDILDDITKSEGLEWSVQDNELQILEAGAPTFDTAVVLSSDTGLVGSPAKTDKGTQITSLLQPAIRPGRTIIVNGLRLRGTYRVNKVSHKGDTHGGEWVSVTESEVIQ